jgi:hypothetical protein
MSSGITVSGNFTFTITQSPPSLAGVWITIKGGDVIVKGKSPMAYTLPDEMQVHVTVGYVDKNGNPAKVDGDTTWSTSHPDIADVTVDSTDSTKALVIGKGIGQAQITTSADADMGEGVTQILATLDIDVVAGQAVAATITPSGAPEPVPAH